MYNEYVWSLVGETDDEMREAIRLGTLVDSLEYNRLFYTVYGVKENGEHEALADLNDKRNAIRLVTELNELLKVKNQ